MKKCNAFTLVELLIASVIFLLVMLTVYSAFHSGFFGYRNIDEAINVSGSARQILERINLDLRNSFKYSTQDSKFVGSKSEIRFLTLIDTFTPEGSLEKDYAFVSYKLEGNRLMRLCRKNKESLREESEIKPEEMNSNIGQISFSYGYIDASGVVKFDKDSWSGQDKPEEKNKLPIEVRVNLTLKNRTADSFERTIFLPLADTNE